MKISGKLILYLLLAFALGFFGFKFIFQLFKSDDTEIETRITNKTLAEHQGLELIFDGKTFAGWRGYGLEKVPEEWKVEDGALVFYPNPDHRSGLNNLITEKEYTSFILSLEWKISEGGNSGIFWGIKEDTAYAVPYLTAPELQILDNENHPDAQNKTHRAGAVFDISPPKEDTAKKAGEWNATVLEINHHTNQGKIWINGILINEFPLSGPEWDALIANTKFKNWQGFGKFKTGRIGLQDHGNKVSFKNIRIKAL